MARGLKTILWLVGALLVGLWLGRKQADEGPPEVETVVQPSPSVVVAVRDLARLEGAVYSVERVIDLKEKQSRFFDMVQAEDAILLVAAGDVVAGVDLSGVREGDITVDKERGRAQIRLPRAIVFSRSLNSERTYVHTRRTDALARRQEALETKARQEAERTLEAAAVQSGLLDRAETNVARTVETLLRSLGYTDVEIRFEGAQRPAAHPENLPNSPMAPSPPPPQKAASPPKAPRSESFGF